MNEVEFIGRGIMKIAIIGAGAMGCLYGGYLSKNNEVVMIDSNNNVVDSINANGIIIRESDGKEVIYDSVKAYRSGECPSQVDLIILFVKSNYLELALEQNKDLFTNDVIVMTLQNGAGNDRKIENYVNKENIIIGTSKHNGINEGYGISRHLGTGVTTIGSNHEAMGILEKVGKELGDSGFKVAISDDIQRVIWSKLFVNLSINVFTAITQTPIGYMLKNEYAWRFAKRLIYEAVDVAEEDGTYFDRREVLESVKKICEDVEFGYSSMYQDRVHKVKTEIDAINGAIVNQAKLYGVPVPYNSLIVDLVHAIEGTYDLEVK